ncbi:MAG: hypothetical protein Q4A00_03530 [Flavobacteriaceae bacterium]|nr:hypothetical protein [Flavobacteriaceae bacterium]
MKKIFVFILVASSFLGTAQNKVGINTNAPKQTLDIDGDEGTLGISNTEKTNENDATTPLGWIPSSIEGNTADDNGKIVDYSAGAGGGKPGIFRYARWAVNISTPNRDKVNNIKIHPINIQEDRRVAGSPKPHEIILTSVQLQGGADGFPFLYLVNVPDSRPNGATGSLKAFPIVGANNRIGTGKRGDILTVTNFAHNAVDITSNITLGNVNGKLAMPVAITLIHKEVGGVWRFYGDYPDTFPMSFILSDTTGGDYITTTGAGGEAKNQGFFDKNQQLLWNTGLMLIPEKHLGNRKILEIDMDTNTPPTDSDLN